MSCTSEVMPPPPPPPPNDAVYQVWIRSVAPGESRNCTVWVSASHFHRNVVLAQVYGFDINHVAQSCDSLQVYGSVQSLD